MAFCFFFSSRRRHTRCSRDWSSDVCSSDLDGNEKDLERVYTADDLAQGENIVFCATGISDSALLRGVKSKGTTAITHSILMRAKSKTVRLIRAMHNLQNKTIRLRSDNREHLI